MLLHTPPVVVSPRTEDAPEQILNATDGVNGAGVAFTVITVVAAQEPTVYDIVAVPGDMPPTVPPVTDATAVLLLLHTPPVLPSISVAVVPLHIAVVAGEMAAGPATTVTVLDTLQLPTVYTIVAVPAATPCTVPSAATVATPVFALLHTPPVVRSLSTVVALEHSVTLVVGVIVPAPVVTFTVAVYEHAIVLPTNS